MSTSSCRCTAAGTPGGTARASSARFFFSSRRRHTRCSRDWSSDVCSSDLVIGPAISWPAFDLGRVRAQIAGSRARADVALAGYEQTVLRALEETENALVTHARTRDSLKDAQDAARESLTAARIARTRYEGGMVAFLAVLAAQRTQLAAEDRLAQVRTDAATSLIAVYKALGGGWEMAPMPRYVRQAGG